MILIVWPASDVDVKMIGDAIVRKMKKEGGAIFGGSESRGDTRRVDFSSSVPSRVLLAFLTAP